MSRSVFHPSIEGAQHGAKSLDEFLRFARESGAAGAQPSNYLIQKDGGFMGAREIRAAFERHGLGLDGVSSHCIWWVHTTAWTRSPTIRPFLPADVWRLPPERIERWCEDYLLRFMDLLAELGVRITPMFWGAVYGWEVAAGYPWGFFKGPDYDLLAEGRARFVEMTSRLRAAARERGIHLAHEIHPGTAAMTAADFLDLVNACEGDPCMCVIADPSHCWEGERWECRFRAVGSRVVAAHVKDFVVRPGYPLRSATGDWRKRAHQFVDLGSGDINLVRFAEMLIDIGYPQRYMQIMGTDSAPLVVEAESAYRDLDATSAEGIRYVRDKLCFPIAGASFEEGMGA